eukprot:PhM_4_TR12030/c0_g2_i1/m.73375
MFRRSLFRRCAQKAEQASGTGSTSTALGTATSSDVKPKNFNVMTTTTKSVYIHYRNQLALWWWFRTDGNWWYFGGILAFIASHVVYRFKVGAKKSAENVSLGETLLDERTRDLLGDVEKLREKDPLRLEKEANEFHERFWKTRAHAVTVENQQKREKEMKQTELIAQTQGTDMSEWLHAKGKDAKEREIARRTHDYIQGFHQHLKVKRLI